MPHAPIILLGTKSDLRENLQTIEFLKEKKREVVRYEEVVEMMKKIHAVKFIECSALSRRGLKEVFEEGVRVVLNTQKQNIEN